MEVCGLREGFRLRDYQTLIVSETLKEFEEKSRQKTSYKSHSHIILGIGFEKYPRKSSVFL
jgi:hypothetical protein